MGLSVKSVFLIKARIPYNPQEFFLFLVNYQLCDKNFPGKLMECLSCAGITHQLGK